MKVHGKDKRAVETLRRLLHNGQISISPMYLTPHTAVIPELQRALGPHVKALAAQFGYRCVVAILNDVPSHPQAIIDALASQGVNYFLIGANTGFSNPRAPRTSR